MIYVLAALAGVVAGFLSRGRIANLTSFRLVKSGWIIAAFITQIALLVLGTKIDIPTWAVTGVELAVFGLLVYALWFNRHYIGVWVLAAGCICNGLVMALNGGKMPVSVEAARRAGILEKMSTNTDIKHMIAYEADSVRLYYLSDIFAPPSFLGFMMKVVSIGDLLVAAGLFFLIWQGIMGKPIWSLRKKKNNLEVS